MKFRVIGTLTFSCLFWKHVTVLWRLYSLWLNTTKNEEYEFYSGDYLRMKNTNFIVATTCILKINQYGVDCKRAIASCSHCESWLYVQCLIRLFCCIGWVLGWIFAIQCQQIWTTVCETCCKYKGYFKFLSKKSFDCQRWDLTWF